MLDTICLFSSLSNSLSPFFRLRCFRPLSIQAHLACHKQLHSLHFLFFSLCFQLWGALLLRVLMMQVSYRRPLFKFAERPFPVFLGHSMGARLSSQQFRNAGPWKLSEERAWCLMCSLYSSGIDVSDAKQFDREQFDREVKHSGEG